MYFNCNLGGARRIAKITIDPELTVQDNAAGEATRKLPVFGRLLSLSATYVQGSAMAAAGEWRDEVGSSKLTSVSQTLLTWKPSLVKVCGKLVQISDASCALSSKTAFM